MRQGRASIVVILACAGCGAKSDADERLPAPPQSVQPVNEVSEVNDYRGPSPLTAGLRYYEYVPRPPPPPMPPPGPSAKVELDTSTNTPDEINRVIRARAGIYRACYQKELNRTPGIAGKVIITFTIGPDGVVKRTESSGKLTNEAVTSCLKANFMRLRFPARGTETKVRYPLVFSAGG